MECAYTDPTARPQRFRRINHVAASTPAPTTRRPSSQATPSLPRADVAREISYLSLKAAGEQQPYIGSSSGVLFADLVQSRLDAVDPRPPSPQSTAGSSEVVNPPLAKRDEDLPPEAVANELIQDYLDHDAIIYPFMLPSHLVEIVHRFYQVPGYYVSHATAFEAFSFYMLLAITASRAQKSQWQVEQSPTWFHSRAMRDASSVLATGTTERLQAILLLCQYRLCSPIRDNSASVWHLVGIAARLCVELGLHRQSSYPILAVHGDSAPQTIVNYQDQETRRRCFWTLLCMDRIVSIVLGRPFALHDDDIDTALPREDSDEIMACAHKPLGVVRIAVSNKIFKYRLLCGRFSLRVHGKRSETASREEFASATQALAEQLQIWYESQPRLEGLQIHEDSRQQQSCYLSPEWYDLLAANASLMLWRPHLLPESGHNRQALDCIFASATTAINIYADLLRSRKINYNWVTLQAIFLAGLSYVSTVNQHFRHKHASVASTAPLLTQEPVLGDIVRTTRACSKVLVAVGERWDLPPHSHEVFDRLSDAVIADAMQCNAGQRPVASLELAALRTNESTSDPCNPPSPSRHTLSWADAEVHSNDTSWMTTDNEFMSCFDDLQRLYDDQYLNNTAMDLSQDWLGSLGVFPS